MTRSRRPHGRLLAAEVGELAGVSGTTIGQWARWGYIASSQSDEDARRAPDPDEPLHATPAPRVYSVEDAGEAAIVAQLLARGVRHKDIRALRGRLRGRWPLQRARLVVARNGRYARVLLRDGDALLELGPRGWQALTQADGAEDVHLSLAG